MEEEQKWGQEVVEGEEKEEESTLQVRKSRTEAEAGDNGSTEKNGHRIQRENGSENGKSTIEDGHIMEEFDGILEEEDGKEKSDNCVYYDKHEGIWKCRICYWTHQSGSLSVDHIQNHNEHLHKLMSDKIRNQFNCETEGVAFTSYSEEEQIKKNSGRELNSQPEDNVSSISSLQSSEISTEDLNKNIEPSEEIESAEIDPTTGDELEVKQSDVERVLQNQTTHDLFCPNCNSCITRRVILCKRKRTVRVSSEEVKRNKLEGEDTSKVVTEILQETDDQDRLRDGIGVDEVPTAEVDDNDRETGPVIFRCLACFSFFIPTKHGFRRFGRSREEIDKENVEDVQVPSVKKNWFASIFMKNRQETSVEQGSRLGQETGSKLGDHTGQSSSAQKASVSEGPVGSIETNKSMGGTNIVSSSRQGPSINSKGVIGIVDNHATRQKKDSAVEHLEVHTSDQLKESKLTEDVQANSERGLSITRTPNSTQATNGESLENGTLFSPKDGSRLLISSTKDSVTHDGQIPNSITEIGITDKFPVLKESEVGKKVNESVDAPHEFEQHAGASFLTGSVVETKDSNFTSSGSGGDYHTEVSQHAITTTKFEVHKGESNNVNKMSLINDASVLPGGLVYTADLKQVAAEKDAGFHTVLTIDPPIVEAASSQSTRDTIIPAETGNTLQSGAQTGIVDGENERRKAYQIEVIKSMVYGGLAESITSLSIVSSAAGGDTATLNVIALGLANLIGGFFVIIHNLWELKSNRVEQVSTQITEYGDRYRELLGRRQNFVLHATVALLSYCIFGLVPPVTYGFSFLKSDDKELKLLAVAAASLVCIVMLAVAKAHCQSRAYLKTVTAFIILGFMVSGASYAAGVLIERLLEKLGLFVSSSGSSSGPNRVLPGMKPTHSAWSSY